MIHRNLMMGSGLEVIPPVPIYRDSLVTTANSSTSTTFSDADIGPASTGRLVVVVVTKPYARPSDNITDISIDGSSMTLSEINPVTSGAQGNTTIAIGHLIVPTGTTADIVVTWGDVSTSCQRYIGVFTVDDMTGYSYSFSSDYATNVTYSTEAINIIKTDDVTVGKSCAIGIAATLSTDGTLSMSIGGDTTLATDYGPTDIRTGEEVWVSSETMDITSLLEISISLVDAADQDGVAALLGVFTKA